MTTLSNLLHCRQKFVYLLPVLFAVSFFLALSPQSAHAGTGYLTRNLDDFDGFLGGNPYYTNSWPQFTIYGNKNSPYNGYDLNLPSLCKSMNASSTSNCNSNYSLGGTDYNTWLQPKLSTPLNNGYNIAGIEYLYLNNSTEVPNQWKGNRIILTLDLNFSVMTVNGTTGDTEFTPYHNAEKLNWGAVTLINRGNSNTCNDLVTFRFITTEQSTDDFVSFELDYTNVTKDMVCNIYPQWRYGGNESHGYLYYGDFSTSDGSVVVHNPYVGWDIVTEQNTDDIGVIIDDWKEQQGEEFERELETIQNNGNNAQNSANSLNLSFNVINIFSGWLGLFTSSGCVDIPTIATMVHVSNSRVCSPWPASVRAVTSPVMATFGTVLLSFFIYRWLMNREGQELE